MSESNIKLSDEFKKDLRRRIEVNWPAISGLTILIIIIFALLGVGTYQIFYKPEKVDSTTVSSEEKIQSRPKEETKQTQPAATAPATTTPAPTATPKPAAPTTETYTVVEGDTLSGIAAKFDTTSKAIADYNGWSDPEQTLQIGQKIKIPK